MKMNIITGPEAIVEHNVHKVYDWRGITTLVDDSLKNGQPVGFSFNEMKAGQKQGFGSSFRDRFSRRGVRLASKRLNPDSDTGYQFQICKDTK